jgi:hypothetical protein
MDGGANILRRNTIHNFTTMDTMLSSNEYYRRRFQEALEETPDRNSPQPWHSHQLHIANFGCLAGLSDGQMRAIMRQKALETGRSTSRFREIDEAIAEARRSAFNRPRCDGVGQSVPIRDEPLALKSLPERSSERFLAIAATGKGLGEYDFWEASSPRPERKPFYDGLDLLDILFQRNDFIFVGECRGQNVRKRDACMALLQKLRNPFPFFAINPFTGQCHTTRGGKLSYRCDGAVAELRYAMAEFDGKPGDSTYSIENQLAFWGKARLPIVALIHSGNKSIHAIISLLGYAKSPSDWQRAVRDDLFRGLALLGADTSTGNPSRLSRIPGHIRAETGRRQKLIYLNAEPQVRAIF